MKKRNKRRYWALIFVIIVVFVAICMFIGTKKDVQMVKERYTVQPGDKIWNIAIEHKPEDMSIRGYINLLYRENPGLTDYILPGQGIDLIFWEEFDCE